MENLKRLTSQQLFIACGGALLCSGAMLGHGNRLGYATLALAVICGVGAFIKRKSN